MEVGAVAGVFSFVQSASRRDGTLRIFVLIWGALVTYEHTLTATDERSLPSCFYCGGPFRVTHHSNRLTFYACVRCAAAGVQSAPPEHEFLYRIEELATREREGQRK